MSAQRTTTRMLQATAFVVHRPVTSGSGIRYPFAAINHMFFDRENVGQPGARHGGEVLNVRNLTVAEEMGRRILCALCDTTIPRAPIEAAKQIAGFEGEDYNLSPSDTLALGQLGVLLVEARGGLVVAHAMVGIGSESPDPMNLDHENSDCIHRPLKGGALGISPLREVVAAYPGTTLYVAQQAG